MSARTSRIPPMAVPSALIVLATVALTWPQTAFLATAAPGHVDTYFSMWRLSWIAHALRTNPAGVFDANIFHPAKNTLAMSDAMLLEGTLAAPLAWAGAPPVLVYNLMLLTGIAGSGIGMFVLVRHLTGGFGPALVAAVIFALAPYRFEHYMHLELQWAMWIPLALWGLHRTVEERSWRFGALTGVFLWLQVLSSVYYGVFLAISLAAFAALLMVRRPIREWAGLAPRLAVGPVLAAGLTAPYAAPYLAVGRSIGGRPIEDVTTYSAVLTSYLASPSTNWLWGWTAERWGAVELSLFPGALAIALAVSALAHRSRPQVLRYLALAALAIELSLGLNGRLYPLLFEGVQALQGLRAPSRFAIVALGAIAVLAGHGYQTLAERLAGRGGALRRAAVLAAALAVLAAEYRDRDLRLAAVASPPARVDSVYAAMQTFGPGAVLELPLPSLDRLPGHEAMYAYWSAQHWFPLVNGYSGYYPPEYIQTVVRLEAFPDDRSLAHLALIGVRYIIVHRAYYSGDAHADLVVRMMARPELKTYGTLQDPIGQADLFVVDR